MSRTKKIIRNCLIILVFILIFFNYSGMYLTPISAHEFSEKSIHYGPSKIKHIEDYDKGEYLLCQYDKWVSCDNINRTLFFFWSMGGPSVTGFENNKSEAVDFSWCSTYNYYRFYGIVNAPNVKKIKLILNNGNVLTQTNFYDGLFLITWHSEETPEVVDGYDINGKIIYTKKISS